MGDNKTNMNNYGIRLTKMMIAFVFYGLGVTLTLKADIGYAPWEVFHAGVANTFGLSIGLVSIIVGVVIILVAMRLGETMGVGTILNMIFIGVFIDMFNAMTIIPQASNFTSGLGMMAVGMTIISYATYLYISTGFGTGPRDGLMVALSRITGFSAGVCRGGIEVSVTVIGYFLGGLVGIGTVISAFAIGFILQGVFKVFRFEPKKIQHETLQQTLEQLKNSGGCVKGQENE